MLQSLQNLFRGPAALAEGGPTLAPAPLAPAGGAPEPFASVLDQFVTEVNGKMEASAAEQSRLLSGDSANLHQAMISLQEASVSFSLLVEVRNKLVEGYQELMRMQI